MYQLNNRLNEQMIRKRLMEWIVGIDGLSAYYPLLEIEGEVNRNYAPSSKNVLNGTPVGVTLGQPGKVGRAISFDGVNDYIDLGVNAFDLAWNGSISLMMLVLPIGTTFVGSLFMKQKDTAGFNGWGFDTTAGKPRFANVTTITTNDIIVQTTNAPVTVADKLYMLGLSVDTGTTIKIYLNGVSQALSVQRNNIVSGTGSTGFPCNIGGRNNAASGTNTFAGKISHVAVFNNKVLSDSKFLKYAKLANVV